MGIRYRRIDDAVLTDVMDRIPDVVFFVKDRRARYTRVNRTLLDRCGIQHRADLLGRTAEQVFPAPLGDSYSAQDREVLETGVTIRDRLELHIYPGGAHGWCFTFKAPLRKANGKIVGLIGISRDLQRPEERTADYRKLAEAIDYLRSHYDEPVRLEALARRVGLSSDRFERLAKKVFGATPRQLLIQARLSAASRWLRETERSVAEIAFACGYSDHSAFTRQFKATVGVTPREFRLGAVV